MRNILIISSFDPINNDLISDIKQYSNKDTKFYFCLLYSKYCSIEIRKEIIGIAFKDELLVNYAIIDELASKLIHYVDLVELIKSLNEKNIGDINLLVHDEKAFLVPQEKIFKANGELKISETAYDTSRNQRTLKDLNTKKEIIDYIVKNRLYFMRLIEEYINGKRLEHCISVANTAYEIAVANGLENPDQYYIAGLLHDVGKQASEEESVDIMEKYYRNYVSIPAWARHEFVGAVFAQKLFPDINKECVRAILTHATGDENMSKMQKIIYASDKIDPSRGYDSSEMINACKKDFNSGFIFVLNENLKFICSNKGSLSRNFFTDRCLNCYINDWKVKF